MNETMNHSRQSSEEQQITIPFEAILGAIVKFWYIILILAVVFGGFMFYRSYAHFNPLYRSSVTFTVHTQEIGSSGIGMTSYSFSYNRATANQLSSTFPNIIKSNILQDIICNDLEISALPVNLSASSVKGTNMFTISAEGSDPNLTYEILQSVIKNYPAVADYVIGNTDLVILSYPEVPTEPYNTLNYRNEILKGAAVGAFIGILWAVVYVMLRRTVTSRSDITEKLGQKCVSVLPNVSFKKYGKDVNHDVIITNKLVSDSYREAVRGLRNAVMKSASEYGKVIMVTSTAPSEGKTTTAVNLALSAASMKKNVIIVDADLRSPTVRSALGAKPLELDPADRQLVKISKLNLSGDITLSVLNFNTAHFKLWNIVRHDNLKSVFDVLRKNYDYVIVDTSPIGLTSESAVFGSVSDCAYLVVKHDDVRVSRIRTSIDTMLSSDVQLAGCILNGASSGIGGYGYGYKYGYGGYHYGYHYGYGYKSGYGYGSSNDNK